MVLAALPLFVPQGRFANAVIFSAIVSVTLLIRAPGRPVMRLSTSDGLRSLVLSACLGVLGVIVARGPENYPGTWPLLSYAGFVIITILLLRGIAYGALHLLRRRGLLDVGVVLGQGQDAQRLAEAVSDHPEYGVCLTGALPAPSDADEVRSWIAGSSAGLAFLVEGTATWVIRAAMTTGVKVLVVPSTEGFMSRNYVMDDSVWRVSVIELQKAGALQRAAKRALDVLVSATALIVLLPALALIGFLITRETGGAMLFRQQRVGQGGRTFELLKFQTMVPANEVESQTNWNVSNDDRLLPFGRLLRKTSLDELPQLLNVLRGEMSLVGPRPERPHFVAKFSELYPHYADRHRVPVGLTGWAQIHRLRGDTPIEDRAYLDNMYADRWSLFVDLKVLMRTVPEVLRRSGG